MAGVLCAGEEEVAEPNLVTCPLSQKTRLRGKRELAVVNLYPPCLGRCWALSWGGFEERPGGGPGERAASGLVESEVCAGIGGCSESGCWQQG